MKLLQKNRCFLLADLLPLLVIFLCTFLAAVCYGQKTPHYNTEFTALTDGWQSADGQTLSLDALPLGDVTLTHSLTGSAYHGKSLCFKSSDTWIDAAFDGETVYHYAPEQPPLFGRSYGMYIHMIPIPDGVQTVTLTLHPLYSDSPAYLEDSALEDAAMFMGDVYHDGLADFALCALIGVFGVLMLIMGMTNGNPGGSNTVNFFSLGVFALLVGTWSANDTYIVQVFTQHPEIMRFVNDLCLIFVAYLPVSLMASATNHRKTVLLPVLLCLVCVNFAVTMLLSLLGISDVRQMLPFSHFNIAVALGMTIYLMIRAARAKTIDRSFLRTMILGMTCAVVCVAVDLLRSQLFPNNHLGSSFFTRIGVLIFIILVGLHLMRERTRIAVERGQAELMKRMAYTDGLTGIANRAAFHVKEDTLRQERTPCVIVQLDINFLKTVNDVYGHAEGDRHILQAAKLISESFADLGTCYRTGGDEFIAVADRGDMAAVDAALQTLEQRTAAYNAAEEPPVPLQIAFGTAAYTPPEDTLETAEKLADQRMYEKKRAMKQAQKAQS